MVSVSGNPTPKQPIGFLGGHIRLSPAAIRAGAGARAEKEYGLFRSLGILWRNFRQTENLKVLSGLFLRDGIPRAVDLGLLFPPFGWIVTALGYLGPKQLAARRGEKTIQGIKKAHPEGVPGPLAKFEELQAIWRNPVAHHKVEPQTEVRVWERWINQYNEMLREAFKVDGEDAKRAEKIQRAVRRLEIKEDKFIGRRIRDHFLVKLDYGSKRLGRTLNFLLRNEVANRHTTGFMGKAANFMLKPFELLRRIPVIKWPFLAAGALLQGGLMLNIARKLKAGQLNHLV